MQKNINYAHTFMRGRPDIERLEHGLKKTPTKAQMQKMEMKEHGFKTLPSMSQIMGVERKEHLRPRGRVVIGKGYKGGAK